MVLGGGWGLLGVSWAGLWPRSLALFAFSWLHFSFAGFGLDFDSILRGVGGVGGGLCKSTFCFFVRLVITNLAVCLVMTFVIVSVFLLPQLQQQK